MSDASKHELFICCSSGEAIMSAQRSFFTSLWNVSSPFVLWVPCESRRKKFGSLKWKPPTKEGWRFCEGHLLVTSDPSSCSRPHPSAPPRPQPSPSLLALLPQTFCSAAPSASFSTLYFKRDVSTPQPPNLLLYIWSQGPLKNLSYPNSSTLAYFNDNMYNYIYIYNTYITSVFFISNAGL